MNILFGGEFYYTYKEELTNIKRKLNIVFINLRNQYALVCVILILSAKSFLLKRILQ